MKYHVEERIFLPDFNPAAIRELSDEFGLVILADDAVDPSDRVRQHYFFTSPAWDGLRQWVIRPSPPRQDVRAIRSVSAALGRAGGRCSRGTCGMAAAASAGGARRRMALTAEQRWIAAKIDTRMQKLIRAGKDDMTIVAAMADHMPNAKQLLGTIQLADLDELTRKFPGFYRYAKILESLAAGIRSGAIPVPGRKAAPQQMTALTDHRRLAAAIDLRMRQLAEEGVPRLAIIGRMVAHVVDLGKIWNGTTDEQLAALCNEYPGFYAYADMMEKAAEAERRKPARPYDDLPELPDALKEQLSSLLSTATKLERDYQSVLNAAGPSAPAAWLLSLGRLHLQWEADLTAFRSALLGAGVSQKSQDMVLPGIEGMAQQIGRLKARLQAS